MMTVKTVCIEVALLISHNDEKISLFSEDQLKSVRKISLTPVFNWKSALKFFPTMTVKTVCIEVALLISHKDEKTSLFSVDQLKCVRKSSLTPVFEKKSAPKFFPMLTVNIVCIEVALLFSHKDGKTIRSATSIQTVLTVIVGKNFSADFQFFFQRWLSKLFV